jgi:hypothetical protein
MKRFASGRVAAFLAIGVLLAPQQAIATEWEASEVAPAPRPVQAVDVALSADGRLTGQAMSLQGQPLAGQSIVISNGRTVASTTTNSKGEFQFAGVRGGAYSVYTGEQTQTCRVWTAAAAPPSATRGLMIVQGDEAVLGQNRGAVYCGTPVHCGTPVGGPMTGMREALRNPLVIGGIVAAAIAIPVAIHNSNDDDPAS